MPCRPLQSVAGMWASSLWESILRTELRSSLEWVSVLPRLLFHVLMITYCLNQRENGVCDSPPENWAGFHTVLGIKARGDVNVGCSPPRQILELLSASLSLALWTLRSCLWDPSLGIRFQPQQVNGSPQLWPATDLPARTQTAAELSSWEWTSWSSSSRGACSPLSFCCGVKSIETGMAVFENNKSERI